MCRTQNKNLHQMLQNLAACMYLQYTLISDKFINVLPIFAVLKSRKFYDTTTLTRLNLIN